MAKGKIKVFHLEMDGQHYYFGSPKAMFDIMGEEAMGMQYRSYHSNIVLKVGDVYRNRRKGYIIRLGEMGQAKTNRGVGMEARINKRIEEALAAHGINQPEMTWPAEEVAPVVEQTPVEQVQPVEQTPVVEQVQAIEQAQPVEQTPVVEQVQAPVAEQPAAPKKPRKKKQADIPEQLTLF